MNKKMAVIVSGWYFPMLYYNQLSAQQIPEGWEVHNIGIFIQYYDYLEKFSGIIGLYMKDMKEDRGELDLTLLIEKHQKEIWDYKQRESEWIRTDNLLKGAYKIVDDMSAKLVKQQKRIDELEFNNKVYKEELQKVLLMENILEYLYILIIIIYIDY